MIYQLEGLDLYYKMIDNKWHFWNPETAEWLISSCYTDADVPDDYCPFDIFPHKVIDKMPGTL